MTVHIRMCVLQELLHVLNGCMEVVISDMTLHLQIEYGSVIVVASWCWHCSSVTLYLYDVCRKRVC